MLRGGVLLHYVLCVRHGCRPEEGVTVSSCFSKELLLVHDLLSPIQLEQTYSKL